MNRLATLAVAAAVLAACSSEREASLARFHGIVAETDSMLVSRWHPGVGIDVHPGFSFACSETACQDGDTVRSSSYFSQLLAETGIDHETEAGGVRVVEGRLEAES